MQIDPPAWSTIDWLPNRFPESLGTPDFGGDPFTGLPWPGIDLATNTLFLTARNYVPRRDPLVLDLDGNGITTTPINPAAPLLFDTDGDGVRTATGWLGAGEAIVGRDLNGNGLIDSGRELFGDATVLTHGPNAGRTAAHGFAALADLDSNADGRFDAADADFASVRLWLDANQDGISQPGELHTLAALGVASIDVAASVHNVDLGGGNVQTYSASFTRTSGQVGSAGTASLAGSLLLAGNSFYRQFTDDPATVPEAAALPGMHASGWVRDLHPAMSLGSPEASALQAALSAFAAAPTRADQQALLDGLLAQWAASSGRLDTQRGAYSLVHEGDGAYVTAGHDLGPNPIADLYVQTPGLLDAQRSALFQKLAVLEVFNGARFFSLTWDGHRFGGAGTGGGMGMAAPSGSGSGEGSVADPVLHFVATMSTAQTAPIEQAWDALRESVYGALVVQTRLKPYLDGIALVIDDSGIHFDASASIARVQARAAADPLNAVADMVDLQVYAHELTDAVGWHTSQTLQDLLESIPLTPEIAAMLLQQHIVSLGAAETQHTVAGSTGWTVLGNGNANTLVGGAGADTLYGHGGNDDLRAAGLGDTLDGGSGNDTLLGGPGLDLLRGDIGNDTLTAEGSGDTLEGGDGDDTLGVAMQTPGTVFIGGRGNDTITGSGYSDTYVFNAGDGQDTIHDAATGWEKTDVLRFGADIAPAQVTPLRVGQNLVFKVGGGTDQVTVQGWFDNPYSQIERVEFADGTVWTKAQINTRALEVWGTDGADTLSGVAAFADLLHGAAGNDTLAAAGSGDTLDGGDGDDTLGAELSRPGTVFIGGRGNDTITGSGYSDTYVFNAGDGQDTIHDAATGWEKTDVLRFGADIAPAQVTPLRVGQNLVFKVGGGTDQVTVQGWFDNPYSQIERVEFADGTVWTADQVSARTANHAPTLATALAAQSATAGVAWHFVVPAGTFADADANDVLHLSAAALPAWLQFDADTPAFSGTPGAADAGVWHLTVTATDHAGATVQTDLTLTVGPPDPLAGDDTLSADTQGTPLHGGPGNDRLSGSWASSTLLGDAGDDLLVATGGPANLLDGGAGNDTLRGGWGQDTLRGGEGDNLIQANGGNAIISAGAGHDSINAGWGDDQIDAGDGNNHVDAGEGQNTVTTGLGDDVITGQGRNLVHSGAGHDRIDTGWGNDTIDAGPGDDVIHAGGGANTVRGGAGDDQIVGDVWADDCYTMARGDGQDRITDSGGTDRVEFEGVRFDQLWFGRAGDDLTVSVIGTTDRLTLCNWYAGASWHVEQFTASDGRTLQHGQVQSLVDAMAAWTPPPVGEVTLVGAAASALTAVWAMAWQ